MQGLMYRLAELDASSANLVRVIDYFDALIRHGADIPAMMRASAALADCVVGVHVAGSARRAGRETRRCDPQGRWSRGPTGVPSSAGDVVVDDIVVGTVWLERKGSPLPLDEMLVDRMALTAASILRPRGPATDVEHGLNLLFPKDDLSVLPACAALELEPSAHVQVIVYRAGTRLQRPLESVGPAVTVEDIVYVPVAKASDITETKVQVGISLSATASTAHRFVGSALFAHAQASAECPVVDASSLGALNLLAPATPLRVDEIPDLVCARELSQTEMGAELLATLRTYLHSGTLRSAADLMHLHHSSVAHRLAKLSHHLGFAVDASPNRARATAMMMIIGDQHAGRSAHPAKFDLPATHDVASSGRFRPSSGLANDV